MGDRDGGNAASRIADGVRAEADDDPFLRTASGGTELYLIRHGDALPEAEELQQGDYDAQYLSERGRRQARALAERLAETHFDAIYTSPLRRTRQTAEPLAARLGLVPQAVHDLREVDLGELGPAVPDGASAAEVAQALRDLLQALGLHAARTGTWDGIPGGEPRAAFRERVTRAYDSLAARHVGGRIACFSHIATINVYLAAALGLERDFFVPLVNTSISIVRVKASQRMVFSINDVCHLGTTGLLHAPR